MPKLDLHGFGTGAVVRWPDTRDWEIDRLPGVAGVSLEDLAVSIDHSRFVWSIYNQGPLPSCVAHSTATMQSAYEKMEGEALQFDAVDLYYKNGGDGRNGVPTGRVLKYAVDSGLPILGATQSRKLQSYAYSTSPEVIYRALCAGNLVVIASLLPEDWWKGDCQSMVTVPNTYHQYLVCGGDRSQRRFFIANSWGTSWGRKGFGSISWDYLTQQGNQNGYFYGYTTIDVIEHQAEPTPEPVIVGYTTEAGDPIAHYVPGKPFVIIGNALGSESGSAYLGPIPLTVLSWSDRRVVCNLTSSAGLTEHYGKSYAVKLFPASGGVSIATGPSLTLDKSTSPGPTPTPTPTPVKQIELKPRLLRRLPIFGGGATLMVQVVEAGTTKGVLDVPVQLSINGIKQPEKRTTKTSYVSWFIPKDKLFGTATVKVDDLRFSRSVKIVTLG